MDKVIDLIIDLTFEKHCKVKEVAYQQEKLVCDDLEALKNELKKNLELQFAIIKNSQTIVETFYRAKIENHLSRECELLNIIIELSGKDKEYLLKKLKIEENE